MSKANDQIAEMLRDWLTERGHSVKNDETAADIKRHLDNELEDTRTEAYSAGYHCAAEECGE